MAFVSAALCGIALAITISTTGFVRSFAAIATIMEGWLALYIGAYALTLYVRDGHND